MSSLWTASVRQLISGEKEGKLICNYRMKDKDNSPALRSDQGVRKPTPQAFDWPFAECKVSPLCAAKGGLHSSSKWKIRCQGKEVHSVSEEDDCTRLHHLGWMLMTPTGECIGRSSKAWMRRVPLLFVALFFRCSVNSASACSKTAAR